MPNHHTYASKHQKSKNEIKINIETIQIEKDAKNEARNCKIDQLIAYIGQVKAK